MDEWKNERINDRLIEWTKEWKNEAINKAMMKQ